MGVIYVQNRILRLLAGFHPISTYLNNLAPKDGFLAKYYYIELLGTRNTTKKSLYWKYV